MCLADEIKKIPLGIIRFCDDNGDCIQVIRTNFLDDGSDHDDDVEHHDDDEDDDFIDGYGIEENQNSSEQSLEVAGRGRRCY